MPDHQFFLAIEPATNAETKDNVVYTAGVFQEPPAESITAGFGTGVSPRRGTEIITGLEWLFAGIRERNLLEAGPPDFNGQPLVTAVSIDNRTMSNRRTSSTLAGSTVGATDLMVGMGAAVTAQQWNLYMAAAFERLLRAVQERLYHL